MRETARISFSNIPNRFGGSIVRRIAVPDD